MQSVMFLKTVFLNEMLATNRTLVLFLNTLHLHVYIQILDRLPTHSTPVQPYFFSLGTDKQNVPSYELKNIRHYSATKKQFTNPHTKQSTIKTGLIPAINSSPSDLQLRALRRRVIW
jgi:hypothetical protein